MFNPSTSAPDGSKYWDLPATLTTTDFKLSLVRSVGWVDSILALWTKVILDWDTERGLTFQLRMGERGLLDGMMSDKVRGVYSMT